MQVDFRLGAQRFVALNGGPQFPHSETVSLQVYVETQEDLDRIWTGLLGSGCPGRSSPLVWASCSPTPIPNAWAGWCANCRR